MFDNYDDGLLELIIMLTASIASAYVAVMQGSPLAGGLSILFAFIAGMIFNQ